MSIDQLPTSITPTERLLTAGCLGYCLGWFWATYREPVDPFADWE